MGFTDCLQRGTEHKSSGKMLRFLTLATVVLSASADKAMMKKIHHDMMAFNSMSACWGKGNTIMFKVAMKKAMESCMHENHSGLLKPANPILSLLNQQADTLPFPVNNDSLGAWNKLWNSRNKRQVEGLLQPTEEDFKEF